jgi:hypothetical protein
MSSGEAAAAVAHREGLAEDWLNDAVRLDLSVLLRKGCWFGEP